LKSESVPGFIPESCPASFRNADRDDFGNVPALPRNPQLVLFRWRQIFRSVNGQ